MSQNLSIISLGAPMKDPWNPAQCSPKPSALSFSAVTLIPLSSYCFFHTLFFICPNPLAHSLPQCKTPFSFNDSQNSIHSVQLNCHITLVDKPFHSVTISLFLGFHAFMTALTKQYPNFPLYVYISHQAVKTALLFSFTPDTLIILNGCLLNEPRSLQFWGKHGILKGIYIHN